MPDAPDSLLTAQYQQSIVASVIELVDGSLAQLPARPATYAWGGEAQHQYVLELERLRDSLWNLRSHLEATQVRLDELAVSDAGF